MFTQTQGLDEKNIRLFQVANPKLTAFCDNSISTSRYKIYTFIPLFLYEQFSKLANVFFLIVGLMEQIPGVSPVGRFITLVPLALIISVSAIKEILEDLKRRKSDAIVNNHKCEVFRKYWQRTTWSQIVVGDIVRVSSGQTFPADFIIISTSEPTQSCCIQTSSLDGETNYKIKQCRPECQNYCNEDYWTNTVAIVKCESPNNQLYKFNGNIKLNNEVPFPIDQEQVILRGSQLKNTHWVVGIVTYTGQESKIMLNSSGVSIKRSTIDHGTNWLVLILISLLLFLTILCASIFDVYLHEFAPLHWYLGVNKEMGITFHLSCITFFILYHNIIPISLMVTLEVVRMFLAVEINNDPQMYSKISHTNAMVKSSSIIEELGQVNYIFTDKTGTLTCNEMVLREISIGTHCYTLSEQKNQDIELTHALSGNEEHLFRMFIGNLLLCNTILPEYGRNRSDVSYPSSSPDETAIVSALAELNYKLVERTPSGVILEIKGVMEKWKTLYSFEFTSFRKRMSVIVQSPTNEIYLFCKGADTVIIERLEVVGDANYEATLNFLEGFAKNGLRTLCIAYRQLTEDEYQTVLSDLQVTSLLIHDREKAIEDVANKIEYKLKLLGVTGIEDKLQYAVPETICALKSAGVKFWMLTGDKLETAMNIGYSCNLLTVYMDIHILSCTSVEDCLTKLRKIRKDHNISPTTAGKLRINPSVRMKLALIVTGQDLAFALDPECIEEFLDICIYCECVICCRSSPLQKKNVLLMVKDHVVGTTALAIGDGANDCSMIRAAHVGVGIIGKEGMQAANTADFAIGEFSHLTRLLFVHGASSYRRICNCIYFCFYKNIVLNSMHFYYDFYNMFSGLVIFSRIHMALFNVFYTSLPPLCFGLLDLSCSAEAHYNVPYLYESIRKSSPFGIRRFIYWTLNGLMHSFLVFFLCYAMCRKGVISPGGNPMSIAEFGNIVLFHTLIVITLKAALEIRYWFWMTHIGICGGFVTYLVLFSVLCRKFPLMIWIEPPYLDTDILMYESPIFWLSLGIPIIALLPDFLFHCIRNTWFTPSYLIVSELERQRQINWTEPENIRSVQTELDRSSELKSKRSKRYFGFAFSTTENSKSKKV